MRSPTVETPTPKSATAPLDLRGALTHSRALAEEALQGETSSRRQLYRALAASYAFFLQAKADPDGYRGLLEEARIRPQTRAPFTPVIKLVFGARLNKTQLSEYAAVLGLAHRLGRPLQGLEAFIEERGLKHCLRDERLARREERGRPLPSAVDLHAALDAAPALGEGLLNDPLEGEFALLLARRSAADASCFEVIALDSDPIRLAASQRRVARDQAGSAKAGRRAKTTPDRRVA